MTIFVENDEMRSKFVDAKVVDEVFRSGFSMTGCGSAVDDAEASTDAVDRQVEWSEMTLETRRQLNGEREK